MPNRVIKESCRTSLTIDALSEGAEAMFYRLTTVADDYGRFDADPRVLLSSCFPRRIDRYKPAQCARWLKEMTQIVPGDEEPLVQLYQVKGRIYGVLKSFLIHQRKRDSTPKFPGPEQGTLLSPSNHAALGGELPQPAASSVSESENVSVSYRNAPPSANAAALARFDDYWKLYPARNGKKLYKPKTQNYFLALSDEEQSACIAAVRAYAIHCRDSDRLPKDPHRFLRGRDGELWREFVPANPPDPAKVVTQTPPPKPVACPEEAAKILRRLGVNIPNMPAGGTA